MKHPILFALVMSAIIFLTAVAGIELGLHVNGGDAPASQPIPVVQVVDKPTAEQPKIDLPGDKDNLVEMGPLGGTGATLMYDETSVKLSDTKIASLFLVILVPESDKGPAFAVIEKVQINCNDHTDWMMEQTAISLEEDVLDHKVFPEKWVPTNVARHGSSHPAAAEVVESLVCPKKPKGHIYTI